MSNRRTGWTRREWLQTTAARTLQAAALAGSRADAAAPLRLGVQLYTVRELLKTRAEVTLQAIAAIGYKELEVGRTDLAHLVPVAKTLGLTSVSTHMEAPLVTGNWDAWASAAGSTPAADRSLAKALETVRTHGVTYAVVSYLQPAERGTTAAGYEKFADQLNRAGETARAAGVTLAYHNHGFEFAEQDGRVPYDIVLKDTDPKLVKLQLDLYWLSHDSKQTPHAWFQRAPGRYVMWHVKDMHKVSRDYTELGNGTIDYTRIWPDAALSGMKHFFVEQGGNFAQDPMRSVEDCAAYVKRNLLK